MQQGIFGVAGGPLATTQLMLASTLTDLMHRYNKQTSHIRERSQVSLVKALSMAQRVPIYKSGYFLFRWICMKVQFVDYLMRQTHRCQSYVG